MDFSDYWSNLKNEADKALEQAKEVGIPVIKASIEKAALDTLKKQSEATQSQVNAAVKTLASNPSSPIGSAVQSTIQKSVLELYAPQIIFGVLALVAIGYMLKGGKK